MAQITNLGSNSDTDAKGDAANTAQPTIFAQLFRRKKVASKQGGAGDVKDADDKGARNHQDLHAGKQIDDRESSDRANSDQRRGGDVDYSNATFSRPVITLGMVVAWCGVLVLVAALFYAIAQPKSLVLMQGDLDAWQLGELSMVLAPFERMPVYSADLDAIQAAAERLDWVDSVRVQKDWQQGVLVQVLPRKALARFGSVHFVDANGAVFADKVLLNALVNTQLNAAAPQNGSDWVNLHGSASDAKKMLNAVYRLNQWFAPTGLRVSSLSLTPRQTWVVKFNSGLILTASDNFDQKAFALAKIFAQGQTPDKVPIAKLATVDLRYRNGFSYTQKSG